MAHQPRAYLLVHGVKPATAQAREPSIPRRCGASASPALSMLRNTLLADTIAPTHHSSSKVGSMAVALYGDEDSVPGVGLRCISWWPVMDAMPVPTGIGRGGGQLRLASMASSAARLTCRLNRSHPTVLERRAPPGVHEHVRLLEALQEMLARAELGHVRHKVHEDELVHLSSQQRLHQLKRHARRHVRRAAHLQQPGGEEPHEQSCMPAVPGTGGEGVWLEDTEVTGGDPQPGSNKEAQNSQRDRLSRTRIQSVRTGVSGGKYWLVSRIPHLEHGLLIRTEGMARGRRGATS